MAAALHFPSSIDRRYAAHHMRRCGARLLADSMTDYGIPGLSHIGWLFVIARNSSFTSWADRLSAAGRSRVGRALCVGRRRAPRGGPRAYYGAAHLCRHGHIFGRSLRLPIRLSSICSIATRQCAALSRRSSRKPRPSAPSEGPPKISTPMTIFFAEWRAFIGTPRRLTAKPCTFSKEQLRSILTLPRPMGWPHGAMLRAIRVAGWLTARGRPRKLLGWLGTRSN